MRGVSRHVQCWPKNRGGQHRSLGVERSVPRVGGGKGVWTEQVRKGMVSLRMRGTPAEEQDVSQSRVPWGLGSQRPGSPPGHCAQV